MQYDFHSNRSRHGILLALVYHWQMLLLHRPTIEDARHSPDQRDFSTQLAFYSADKISDLAGDILERFNVNQFPIYASVSASPSLLLPKSLTPM